MEIYVGYTGTGPYSYAALVWFSHVDPIFEFHIVDIHLSIVSSFVKVRFRTLCVMLWYFGHSVLWNYDNLNESNPMNEQMI